MPGIKGAVRLRAWLDKRHMNQREAAALLEIHWTHVNQMLSGRRKPGLAVALRIRKATGIPVDCWSTAQETAAEAVKRLKKIRLRRKARLRAARKGAEVAPAPASAPEATMDESEAAPSESPDQPPVEAQPDEHEVGW